MSSHGPKTQREAGPADGLHLLSFDVEEFFQAEAAAAAGIGPDRWGAMPKRLAPAVDRILQMLAEHGAGATFFILGWVAQQEPQIVRSIAQAGHEIASHGMTHNMLARLDADQFRQELADSRKLLEDLSGKAVRGFRAPTFSITHQTAWAIDALAETGYRYDSSVFPIRHDRYGVPDAPRHVHRATGPAGGSILEIPPLTLRWLGLNLPAAGGGYLRLLPVRFIGRALKRARREGQAGMIYLHPWELDPDQPILPMPRLSRWRHRVNLRRTHGKLRWLMQRFSFRAVEQLLCQLDVPELAAHRYG